MEEQSKIEDKEEREEEESDEKSMGFLDHLDELRKRIIYAIIGLAIGTAVAGFFAEFIMQEVLILPAKNANLDLQNLRVFGKPVVYFKVVLVSGIIISFPFLLFQLWKFVEPALYKAEKSWARKITFFTSLCFMSGIVFAYYVMIPSMLEFSANFGTEDIRNLIDINEYWSFIMLMILSAGIFFEMPMVSFVLSRFGLLTPRFLRKYRRHAIIVILIIAAILTPSPDPFNQMVVALPIYLLYELSIFISAMAIRKYYTKNEQV